jgi:hypothetical protein
MALASLGCNVSVSRMDYGEARALADSVVVDVIEGRFDRIRSKMSKEALETDIEGDSKRVADYCNGLFAAYLTREEVGFLRQSTGLTLLRKFFYDAKAPSQGCPFVVEVVRTPEDGVKVRAFGPLRAKSADAVPH